MSHTFAHSTLTRNADAKEFGRHCATKRLSTTEVNECLQTMGENIIGQWAKDCRVAYYQHLMALQSLNA
jgi:hypothetical protein